MKLSFKRPYLDAEETNKENFGSGCGSVGRAVASNSRGPPFESSHRQEFIYWTFTVNRIEKTKVKKKRPGMAHLKKIDYDFDTSGQSYNSSTIVNYDSRGILDLKIAHITSLDS